MKNLRNTLAYRDYVFYLKDKAEMMKAESFNYLNHFAASWSPDGIGINWLKGPIYDIWNVMTDISLSHAVLSDTMVPYMTSLGFQYFKLLMIILIACSRYFRNFRKNFYDPLIWKPRSVIFDNLSTLTETQTDVFSW